MVVAAAVTVAAALALGSGDGRGGRPASVDRGLLQRRIERDITALARSGIYVTATGQAATCVAVEVVNPTAPNLDYLRRRYGRGICFDRSYGPAHFCAGATTPPPGRTRVVPDLRDLGIRTATRRAVAAGFSYTLDCAGFGTRKVSHPRRGSLASVARVSAQCPLPGTRAPVNAPITLEAVAILPGRFTYTFSAFEATGSARRCVDGQPR
ncbi:hypothetical protein [Conexibacter woesei]|uniref:hypothetical protein n=1 Tax=Conexibacter woesei TaxID=191495 RepID=UPI00042664F0|nr:hypothetical protein [Conexibacter woesei]